MELLKRQETADMIGISVQTLDRLIKENRIPHIRIGRLIRFDREQIVNWIKSGGEREREKPIYS